MLFSALAWHASAADLAESLWLPGSSAEPACPGRYAEPQWPLPRGADHASVPVEVSAERIHSTLGGRSEVLGNVAIRQGNRWLDAERFEIDHVNARVDAPGGLRLRAPGVSVVAARGAALLVQDEATLADTQFVLTETGHRGTSAGFLRRGDAITLDRAVLTRCPPRGATWALKVESIEVADDQAFARARHARLEVKGVPVLYAPYLRFPLRAERASGFLFPNIGIHDDDGLDIAVPYYLNLAPNYDATVEARSIAARGAGFEAEFRHLGQAMENDIVLALLAKDDLYNGELPRKDFVGDGNVRFEPADRWLVNGSHRGRLGPWRTLIDYAAVSDNDYFVDLGGDVAVASRVSLARSAEVQYAKGGLLARVWAQGFQRLEPGLEPYRRLPEASLAYSGDLPGAAAWSIAAAWSSFRRSNAPAGLAGVGGERTHIEPRIRLPLSRSWGFLNLAAGLRLTDYALARAASPQQSRSIGLGTADGGLFFERTVGAGWLQTLEPRVHYLYQSYADQAALPRFDTTTPSVSYRQLFRDNRFAGLDRIGDANRVAFGLTTRILSTASGAEPLTARIGIARHFRDRRVTLGGPPGFEETRRTTPVAAELQTALGPVALVSTLAWDHVLRELDETGVGLSFVRDGRILNVGYRRRARYDVDQTDISFYWPVAARWRAFGRWNHDWRFGQNIERFAGVEYASCCLVAKLAWHQTVDIPRNRLTADADFDRGILLQLAFRGLGGFGTRVDSRLTRGIKGYRTEDMQ